MQAESVALVRALRRAEERCFEAVGSWAATTDDPAAKVLLNEMARHHAWRAAQWAALDAGVPPPAPDGHDADPSAPVVSDIVLAGSPGDPPGLVRWATDVAPALTARYERLVAACGEVADGPVGRAAARCGHDLGLDRVAVGTHLEAPDGPTGPAGG